MSETAASPGRRWSWPQAILFDLDGTLIDSAPDLAAAVNKLLVADGFAPVALDSVRSMVGAGVRKLVERAYTAVGSPLGETTLDAKTEQMMQVYGRQLTERTTLMPGVTEVLAVCRHAQVKLAVVTNKPGSFSRAILDHFGLGPAFGIVIGGDTGPAKKPAPDMLLYATEIIGVPPGHALMVGDSPADIGAAKAAGMASVAVRGGYSTVPADDLGADIVIDSLASLPAAIERLKEPV